MYVITTAVEVQGLSGFPTILTHHEAIPPLLKLMVLLLETAPVAQCVILIRRADLSGHN